MPGGGRLVVEAQNVEYDNESAAQHPELAPGRYLLLIVTDTGHGMPKEIADRAFDPFFTTKPKGQGTGLGLATVYGIVQQAGGRVSIYSEVDRGTSVRVLLPAVEVAAKQAQPVRELAAPVRPGAVILLVEDEPAVRGAARRILAGSGYEVLEAPDAHAALELDATRPGRIDLLVSDMVMPGLSGRELARRLRERRPDLRVMYMSGYAEEAATGVDDFDGPLLTKPFARRPLLDMVNSVLGGALAAERRPA